MFSFSQLATIGKYYGKKKKLKSEYIKVDDTQGSSLNSFVYYVFLDLMFETEI